MKTPSRTILLAAAGAMQPACVEIPDIASKGAEPAEASIELAVDPPSDAPDRIAPIVQFHLQGAGPSPDVVVARGDLSERDLTVLAEGKASAALQSRVVPSVTWVAPEGDTVVAPMVAWDEGEVVSVGIPSLGWAKWWKVQAEDLPRLRRVWPVSAEGAWAGAAVWCETTPSAGWAPVGEAEVWLGPEPSRGRMQAGMLPGYGEDCVMWQSADGVPERLVPPPWVQLADGHRGRIEPETIEGRIGGEPSSAASECEEGLVVVGPLCGKAQDDRVVLFGNSSPILIGIEIGGKRVCGIPQAQAPMVIRGLAVHARNDGWISYIDEWGRRYDGGITVWTGIPEPHLVINEVMANPAGAEPEQEWVELFNDGTGAVDVGGWGVEDVGMSAELPAFALGAGQFALVVNEGYQADGWADKAPAFGTPLLRVPHLGKSGLSNAGEPLRLVRSDGVLASSVPAIGSPQQSVSIARVAPDACDCVSSFVPGLDGGTPGEANGAAR